MNNLADGCTQAQIDAFIDCEPEPRNDEPRWQSAEEQAREDAQFEYGLNEPFAGEVAAPPVDLRRKRSAGNRPPFERIA